MAGAEQTIVLWGEVEPRPGLARSIQDGIRKLIPSGETFLLVDDGEYRWEAIGDRRVMPFEHRKGVDWEAPENSDDAILQIERLHNEGATFAVFAGSALWWLHHYAGLRDYLCRRYAWSIGVDDFGIPVLVVFELTHPSGIPPKPGWRSPGQGFKTVQRLVPERSLTEKYRDAVRLLTRERDAAGLGDYLEFGVYVGSSLACMHRVLTELSCEEVRLFGFDSFQGLPEAADDEDDGVWTQGAFRSDYETTRSFLTGQRVNWSRVFLIDGWFSETLNNDTINRLGLKEASIIMIDCDLYSSAIQALRFAGPLIRDEAVILFDDWHSGGLAEKDLGERRAFEEFLAEQPRLQVADFGTYHQNAATFHVRRRV